MYIARMGDRIRSILVEGCEVWIGPADKNGDFIIRAMRV